MTTFLCDFNLVKKNTAGRAFGHVYYTSEDNIPGGMKQTIARGTTIRYNRHGKLGAIAMTGKDELTVQKTATYKMSFLINYTTQWPAIQVGIMINNDIVAVFGTAKPQIIPNPSNRTVRQLKGEFSHYMNVGDTVRLIGVGRTFIIKRAGAGDEVIANFIAEETQ